jgi:small GTP-binding protein
MSRMSVISKKICIIGDFGVGKTSLIRRYVDRQFSDHYLSTIGVKISRKQLKILASDASKISCQLMIWDIEGKTEFQSITPSYVAGAKGSIIVADLNRPETLEHIQEHLDLILSINPGNIAIAIALNKSDSVYPEKIQDMMGLMESIQPCPAQKIYVTSAKTGHAIEELFEDLARSLLKNHFAQNTV